MGCCDETKAVVKKAKNIIVGHANYYMGIKYEFTDDRVRACQKCDENTWLSTAEYSQWLIKHGIDVLKNFDQLEKLPKLPKHKQDRKRRRLYCRLCKCFIPAKARIKDMRCPLDNWP